MSGLRRAAVTGLLAVLVGTAAGGGTAAGAAEGAVRTATTSATLQRATQAWSTRSRPASAPCGSTIPIHR